jgi:hypothetical protein
MRVTFFNSDFKSDPTKLFFSIVLIKHVNNGFNSDLKISLLYNIGHNKYDMYLNPCNIEKYKF